MKKHWEIMDPKIMQVEEARPGQAAPIRAYTAQDLRDPFKELLPPPPAQAAAAPMASQAVPVASAARPAPLPLPTLLLSGIWWSVQPRALINGEVYGIGDHVQGATVKRISPEGVTVEFNGREILLQTSNVSAGGKRPRVANWGR
ncbi:MAG: general secretion pathway protein GspB [Candidatus Omnitrophica bacterium]|nr:general secretion pathway protein GspB [Candidatus Omnitrophota bacterium]